MGWIDASEKGYRVRALLAPPTQNYRTSFNQYVFINKRPVANKDLNQTLRLTFQDVMQKGRWPFFVLFWRHPLIKSM